MEIWAKSDGETLKEHTERVKNGIVNLINIVSQTYLPSDGFLAEILREENVKKEFIKLLEIVSTYHDLGKIYPKFQMEVVHNPDFSDKEFKYFPDVPHSFLSPAFFNIEKIKEFESLIKFLKCKPGEILKIVLSAIAFHHWRENYVEKFLTKWELVEKAIEKLKNYNDLIEELKKIDNEISSQLSSHYNKLLIPPDNLTYLIRELEQDFTRKQKNFYILLKGFLHRADHFASSYLEKELKEKELKDEIEIKPLDPNSVENKIKKEIKRRAEEKYQITIKDEDIWQVEKIKECKDGNVFLKASTGVGKTEFALLWAKGKKLIYVLPIRTAVNAMWKRLREVFGDDKVGLLHSDALFYLEDIRDHSRDESISESFISYNLAKNLSYPVIVATADQFFTAGLKYPGYEKIYSTLAYSYIVLDEIQLYEPRIAAIIIKTLEEVTALGARFCIMSATLPEFYKKEMRQRGIEFKEIEHFPKNLKKHKIKLVEDGIIEIDDETREIRLNENIKEKIKSFIQNGKKVLIILNTIKAAKKVYEELKDVFPDKILLIHSQFTLQDRRKKEEIFESKEQTYPDILVSTQVAEVSLDIDYDVLFTELAPLDSLIQRMGRILRRYRDNYEYKEDSPNIFICGNVKNKEMNVENMEIMNVSGVGSVYLKDVLIETYKLLKDKDQQVLEETEKVKLIDEFYANLIHKKHKKDHTSTQGEKYYFSEFDKMLDILDSLYSADSKKRAHEIFRDIIQISGIPQNKKDKFLEMVVPKIEEMFEVVNEYQEFYKKWKNQWKNSDNLKKEELKGELRTKLKEYREKKRKVTHKIFQILTNYLVHLHPDRKIKKLNLKFIVGELINDEKIKSTYRKWLSQIFEGIYLLENVEYDDEKGAIIIESKEERIL